MTENTIEAYLSKHPFFADFDRENREFLSRHAVERDVAAGSALFRQGERAEQFFILRQGQVDVEIPAIYGPALTLQRLGADQILGWSWLISPYEWDFQAHATEDTRIIEFDAAPIMARCEQDPKFGYQLLKAFTALMSERLHSARNTMMKQWMPSGFA